MNKAESFALVLASFLLLEGSTLAKQLKGEISVRAHRSRVQSIAVGKLRQGSATASHVHNHKQKAMNAY